jgi:quinoprotein glucose dehydrogenase
MLSAALTLIVCFTLISGLRAADEVVEMATDLHGTVGQLKPRNRQAEPEINPASAAGRQALARMKLPPGLVATLWAAEPMVANPVAFNFDEHGRMFVAETYRYGSSVLDIRDYMWTLEDDLANRNQTDFLASIRKDFGEKGIKELSIESERIKLLEDTDGSGVADKATVYADNFRSPIDGVAAGVLVRRGEVWFTSIPSLWHFTGHDRGENRTALLTGFGIRFNFTGHDLHGLIFGPDGRIYFSVGDRASSVVNHEGRLVADPDTGSVFRCYPDGSQFEIFATGLRNPQSLLFNEEGDLFTGDNDCDQGDEERLVHVVEGGDSGWRIGYQHAPRGNAGPWNAERLWLPRHPSQPAYILPPICNIEDGPSGIAYYPGTGLTPAYAGQMFITHFKGSISRSGIDTYKVKPAGASYAIEDTAHFLQNALPTDVRFGPDGRLYYSDWADGWPKSQRGRIYAISDPKLAGDPLVKSTQELIGSDYTKKTNEELAALLAHPDWRVRLEAQYTLAERGTDGLPTLAAVATKIDAAPYARRHAVWGLGQLAAKNSPTVLPVLRSLLHDVDAEIRAQAIKLLGDYNDQASTDALVAALGDASSRVKFFAAQSLGKLKYPAATPALLAAIRANNDADAYLRHALVMGLVGCATPAGLTANAKDESRAVRIASVLTLRRLGNAGVTSFLTDTDPLIVREAAEAINDAPITDAFPALATFVDHPVNNEATMLRALNVRFRLGTPADAAALAAFAARPEASATLRAEAVTLLTLWPKPPARDRLVGIYRPLADQTRPVAVAAEALSPRLATLLTAGTPESVQSAALAALPVLKPADSLPALRAVVAAAQEPDDLRAAALTLLDHLGDPQISDSLTVAVASDAPSLRLAALPLATRLHPDTATGLLTTLLERGTPVERRAAYATLGGLKQPEADTILAAELRKLAAGQLPAGAQVQLIDAATLRSDPAVKKLLAEREAALAKDPDPLAPYLIALEGGNPRNGRKLFYDHPVLACVRCHSAGNDGGGEAGPKLVGIGSVRDRHYILESIVKPNAQIAPGFDVTVLTLKSGALVAGSTAAEDASTLTLRNSDGKLVTVKKSDIAQRTAAPSPMPEIFGIILTKAELSDLVEFVYSLKAKPAGQGAGPAAAHVAEGPRALRPAPTD